MADDFACDTIDPSNPDGPKVKAIFPGLYTLRLFKYLPVQYENLRAAKHVLEYPKRIFYGVREDNEDGWCYAGRPVEWHIRERTVAPFPDDMVYVVYLNSMLRIYECRAEYAAQDDPLSPVHWQQRYRGLVWKSIS